MGNIQASMDSVGTGGSLSRAMESQAQYRISESVGGEAGGFRGAVKIPISAHAAI